MNSNPAAHPAPPVPTGRWTWLGAATLFAITAAIFAAACRNNFVNYDDPDYVTANAHVRAGLTAATARWALTAKAASNWHPLTWLSHALDVSLYGLSPAGHHATSVLLHSLNAALAFVALRQLTRRAGLSFVAALLFAVHPLRVESVAWVAERKDVLSGCFFLLTVWAYSRYAALNGCDSGFVPPPNPTPILQSGATIPRTRRPGSLRWYATALGSFGLGLLAKPMLVTLPCILLLLDYWPLGRLQTARDRRRLVFEKLPFFALSLVSSAVTFVVQKQGGAVTRELPWAGRFGNAVIAVPRYLGKIAWPSRLSPLYPHPGYWPTLLILAGALSIVALFVVAWRRRTRQPWVFVGWCWFVGMLVPVIGLVQVGLQSIADRYTYLPVIGLELAVLWTVAEVIGRRLTLVAGVAVAAPLALATIHQITAWKNSLTLFTEAVAVAGNGNYLAYDNRGIAWADRGDLAAAIADYERSLAIKPDYSNAHNNLGLVLNKLGRNREAIAQYRLAIREKPSELEVYSNLANALSDVGEFDEALAQFRYVLARSPDHVNALNGEAVIYAQRGDLAAAERQFQRVLDLDPANAGALTNLGNVYAMTGRREDAARLFTQALARKPDDPIVLFDLGELDLQLGRFRDAADNLGAAARLNPRNADVHLALANALAQLGRQRDATRELDTCLQLQPNYAPALALRRQIKNAP